MRSARLVMVAVVSLASVSLARAQGSPALTLETTAFQDGGVIPVEYSQAAEGAAPGEGTSPPLSWTNTPEGTQSFVLHMQDLEVARNRGPQTQVHWLVWNIPGEATGLEQGVARGRLPNGAHQISATGPVYRGPGAPANRPPHHYVFELYALDAMLEVEPGEDAFATRAQVLEAMQGHVLGKAVYMGMFRRPQ